MVNLGEVSVPALVGVVLAIVLAVIASTGFWSFITNRMQRKDKKEDEKNDLVKVDTEQTARIDELAEEMKIFKSHLELQSKMLRGIGHDRIVYLGGVFLKQGYITSDEYENLHDYLYLPYHELGGNGTAEKVMEEVKKLPTKPQMYLENGGEYK